MKYKIFVHDTKLDVSEQLTSSSQNLMINGQNPECPIVHGFYGSQLNQITSVYKVKKYLDKM